MMTTCIRNTGKILPPGMQGDGHEKHGGQILSIPLGVSDKANDEQAR